MADRWCCTCLCEKFVHLLTAILGLIGFVVTGFALFLILKNPLSNPSAESFKGIVNTTKTEWMLLVAGVFVVVASCLGFRFASKSSRPLGCIFLFFMSVAIGLEVVAVGVFLGTSINLVGQINDFSKEWNSTIKINPEGYNKFVEDGQDAVVAKTFRSWASRFDGPDFDCTIPTSTWNVSATIAERRLGASEVTIVVDDKSTTAGVGTTATSNRIVPSAMKSDPTASKCIPEEKKVTCKKSTWFADDINSYCKAKEGNEATFTERCSQCVDKWYEMFNFAKNADAGTDVKKLHEEFEGPTGTAYCRCVSRFMGSVERHLPQIRIAGCVVTGLQLLLVLSTIWLMCWGPRRSEEAREHDIETQASLPAGRRETVVCPPNVVAGMPVMVTLANGRAVQAIVPPGIEPGMAFQIAL